MHTDPELLGLLALGEHVGTEDDRLHAQTCPECAGELIDLQRVVTLGRDVGAEPPLAVPSQDVWARTREELGFERPVEPPVDRHVFLPSDTAEPFPAGRLKHVFSATKVGSKHARPSPLTLIKSALAGSSRRSEKSLTAHAQLTPIKASWSHASGTAKLASDKQGRRLLQVALQADLPSSGVRQAWLIHREDPSLRQTVGILDGPHGLWTVEQSIDLEKYAILEISQQGTGENAHSGQTIVRGELTLVS